MIETFYFLKLVNQCQRYIFGFYIMPDYNHGIFIPSLFTDLREGTFLIGGGGWAGGSEGRVITKFFPNCGGSNLFYSRLGEGHSFFGKEKITPYHLVDSHSSTNT